MCPNLDARPDSLECMLGTFLSASPQPSTFRLCVNSKLVARFLFPSITPSDHGSVLGDDRESEPQGWPLLKVRHTHTHVTCISAFDDQTEPQRRNKQAWI